MSTNRNDPPKIEGKKCRQCWHCLNPQGNAICSFTGKPINPDSPACMMMIDD